MSHFRYSVSLALCAILCFGAVQFTAQQVPSGGVIRIDVNLVQVDAVVTDSTGKAVTNLTRDDFEVYQDGELQKLTAFDFVTVKDRAAMLDRLRISVGPRPLPGGVPPPSNRTMLKREDIRRTLAFVVDDLALSFDSGVRVRDSLKKWVNYEMENGDLVAIVRTSAGMGSLQRFTTDKEMLFKAIDLIRYQPGRVGVSSFAATNGAGPTAVNPETGEVVDVSIDRSVFLDELEHAYLVGSLGAIQYVVRGLKDLPGRKSLILFSESMKFTFLEGPGLVRSASLTNATSDARIRKLADEANRSSVVIYAIDPRGVVNTELTAEDNLTGLSDVEIGLVGAIRAERLIESQDGMIVLSQKTGGLFVRNNNDMTASLRQVVDDGDGYYLLGYQPDLFTFEETRKSAFHSIKVRVKRPGLTVRSRTGFFGKPDNEGSIPQTRKTQITDALASPFASDDLRVRLTGLFSPSEKGASVIDALLHFDARDVTFSEGPDGSRTAEGDIVAMTFDADGQQVDTVARSWKIVVQREAYDRLLTDGVVYTAVMPVKKPGGYQLRAVVRDAGSQRLGSAMQYVEVPDVKKGRLTLSSIVMGAETLPNPGESDAGGPMDRKRVEGSPAVRIFRSGAMIHYAYEVLNARLDNDKKPQLETQIRLFRDGQPVYVSRGASVTGEQQQKSKRLFLKGQFQLKQISAGDYTLQIVVQDNQRYDKYRIATQAMDFQVRD
ncbi:MAG TPA: VWA domain-containing protein [Terriglobia bacterium]|nr:VWA domain-containing protein [Terriglobia bacterium]